MTRDRRTVLADAALSVLADGGMRALTHRAVDAAAGLPTGTTSAYLRTRKALLTALAVRLVELDQTELGEAAESAPLRPEADPDELAEALARFSEARLTGEGRRRTLARYACTVESVYHPELREVLVPRENAARDAVRAVLAAHGVADPDGRTVTLLACVDGLVFERLTGPAADAGGLRDEIRALVDAALRP
ncbi:MULTISPECIES: TetR family transcriptional regulator C-terminal domain-containing protein [unclassified Streptomyces]|uniref:TetR/AcrR family transcriptional regulator n=1 Tax=unclassified Streptomyces TaxID=2593676 RepID=UPI0033AF73EB